MRLPSASRIEIALACPGAMHLEWSSTRSGRADRGTAIHAYVETAVETGRRPDVAAVYADVCMAIQVEDIAALFTSTPATEVAYAYNPVTDDAMRIGDHVGRDYSAAPAGSICGAADLVDTGRLVVDIKCGRIEQRPGDLAQLRFLGLAEARVEEMHEIDIGIVQISDDGAVWIEVDRMNEIDLDAAQSELAEMVRRIEAAEGDPHRHLVAGPHCQWCPAALHCPVQAASVQALVPVDQRGELTAEVVVTAYNDLKAAQALLKRVDAAIRGYVLHTPVPMGGGKELRIVTEMHDKIDAKTAIRIVEDVYGADAARAASNVTKASLNRAVPKAERRGLLTAIADAGGLTTVPVDKMRVVKVK